MAVFKTLLSDSLTCEVTQVYGSGHNGTDIQFKPIRWSKLYFPKAGVVSISQFGGSGELWTYGEWYQVDCNDGTQYRMAHLREGTRAVRKGENVIAGQYAGEQGNTGRTEGATGIHLHLEYFVSGSRRSPEPLMGFPDSKGVYDIEWGDPDNPPHPEPLRNKFKWWLYLRRW